jgi:hypothetical protein
MFPALCFRFMECFFIFQPKLLRFKFRLVYDTHNKSRYLKYFHPYLSNAFVVNLAQHPLSCCLPFFINHKKPIEPIALRRF